MDKIKNILKNEVTGWKKWEVFWLIIACVIITCLSIYWGDNIIGIISATTGIACVICTGKGKLSAYIFGLVNCVLYAIISYNAKYYGEVMFNVLSIPMQIIGFIIWSKNMNAETYEVKKKRMTNKGRCLLILSILVGTIIYGFILKYINGEMPFVDSFTTISSVIAMIISIKMFSEQWYLWIYINVISIILWICNLMNGTDNWATLLMWTVYLLNSIIMLIKWEKEAK